MFSQMSLLEFYSYFCVGMYVANRASDKITQLTDNVYVCRSGSVVIFFQAPHFTHSSLSAIQYCGAL